MDCLLMSMGDMLLLHYYMINTSFKMNKNMSQATQTRDAKSSDSENDSLDTFSLRNETWITDPDADDEAEASDRSKIKPEKLEQAISKAEMELKELQESYAKMKCTKSSRSKASQLPLKERLRCVLRSKSRTKDGKGVEHKGIQVTPDSESQSGGPALMRSLGSERKRQSHHATTSVAKYSSDADCSETEEIKKRENHIQEVIVKVESKIHDMRTILEKLIQTKAQEKRDKIDKEMMELENWGKNNKEHLRSKSDLKVKIKDIQLKIKEEAALKKNKSKTNQAESPKDRRNSGRKTESNINISKEVEFRGKHDIKDKERPSTTKSLERRPRSSASRGKRSHSAKSQGKESDRKSRSRTGSTDS